MSLVIAIPAWRKIFDTCQSAHADRQQQGRGRVSQVVEPLMPHAVSLEERRKVMGDVIRLKWPILLGREHVPALSPPHAAG